MEKTYNPSAIERAWYDRWQAAGLFHSDAGRGGEPYCIVIPPPNVTGILHMGHALNNTIQDILVRWRRMQGRNTVWMPGTDHAGIATQNVVERALRAENRTREDLGREDFVERVWRWRAEYGSTIINQLKRLGASCDWQRERFTMDEGLSDAVAEVFVRLHAKGLIYRRNYIINWCPRCHTALSDEESAHAPARGKLYYIRYPLGASGRRAAPPPDYVVVATTRPETLLGDVAVAVNPRDARYRDLPGRVVTLPVLGRALKVIRDDFVDPAFGTGVVKVTPAHDPNDFEMGLRHGLEPVNVMNGDGSMNEAAGPYAGMDRFECRKRILKQLEDEGLLEKVEDHEHAVGHCYRCDCVVEPRLSLQWFVKMKPLAAPAIEAVKDGRVVFVPARWTKVYLEWMENIRDWCISRQIWWGHRIPVFTCGACGKEWAQKGRPETCPQCGGGKIEQDPDVLDTWFSSWLWPFSTFGWPDDNPDLRFYYPTHDLVTASEIIFFWVARMIMAGLEFMGDVPFRRVYIHGTVRDDAGLKMSKSLGNSIDPLTVIDEFSADALRFSLMMITATGQDVFISKQKFEIGRNFGTKIWNAARFMRLQGKPAGGPLDPARLSADDMHIIAKLQAAARDCASNLERCRLNDAAAVLYEFVWHQFCDWYVEYAKDALGGPNRDDVLDLMDRVLHTALRLLHPFMPFLTEELWHAMGYGGADEFIMTAPWPDPAREDALKLDVDAGTVQYVEEKHALITAVRALRGDLGIAPSKDIRLYIEPRDAKVKERLTADAAAVGRRLNAEIAGLAGPRRKKAMPSVVCALGTVYLPLEGVVDAEAESRRLSAEIEKADKYLAGVGRKLRSVEFMTRAPREVVERQKAQREEVLERKAKLETLLKAVTETRRSAAKK